MTIIKCKQKKSIKLLIISSDGDKRLQTFDKITTYPHGTNVFTVCKSDILLVMKYKDFVSIEQIRFLRLLLHSVYWTDQ